MDFNTLTDKQKEAVLASKTPEELHALAKEEGYELSDEELEQVAGGGDWADNDVACPDCGAIPTYVHPSGLRCCKVCGKEGGF